MGAGSALFINKKAVVSLRDVTFSGNHAIGGSTDRAIYSGGGGGLGGDGTGHGGGGLGLDANSGASSSEPGAGIGTSPTASSSGHFGGNGIGQVSNNQSFNSAFNRAGGIGAGGVGQFDGSTAPTVSPYFGGFGAGGVSGLCIAIIFGSPICSDAGPGGFGAGGGDITLFYGVNSGPGGNYYGQYGNSVNARGGFGGGGGGPAFYISDYSGSVGGFGGGGGKTDVGGVGGGYSSGGGAGFGGAVFARGGSTLTIQGSGGFSGGGVTAGTCNTSTTPLCHAGAAAGTGLFAMSGVPTVFDVSDSYTINDSVADDSKASIPGVPPAFHKQYAALRSGCTPGQQDVGDYPNEQKFTCGTAITKQGAGVLSLSGANTYAGDTTVSAGVLEVNGALTASTVVVNGGGELDGNGSVADVLNGGTVHPGAYSQGYQHPETLQVSGDYVQDASGTFVSIPTGSTPSASTCNRAQTLAVTGIATLDGTLTTNTGTPQHCSTTAVGTVFHILTAGHVSGHFSVIDSQPMSPLQCSFIDFVTNVTYEIDYLPHAVDLKVVPAGTVVTCDNDAIFFNGFDTP